MVVKFNLEKRRLSYSPYPLIFSAANISQFDIMAKRICRNLHRARCFAKHNPPAQKHLFIWCLAIIELFLHEILF